MPERRNALTAILPCNDIAKSHAFYERLGFAVTAPDETLVRIGWPTQLRKPS